MTRVQGEKNMQVVFVTNPDDMVKCSFPYGHGKFGCWDCLNGKLWIWLFNFKKDMETMIERLCYVIEHEWLHELFAHHVSYSYRGLAHWIIWHLQSWRINDEEWETAVNRS